jgi:hypothetical protein
MKKPDLQEIYKGNFAKRNKDGVVTAYDGGYISYAAPDPSSQYLNYDDSSGNVTNSSGSSPLLSSGLTSGQAGALNTPVNTPPPNVSLNTLPTVANGDVASQQGGLGGALSGIGGSNLLPLVASILTAAGHASQMSAGTKLPTMPAMGNAALPALPGQNGSTGYGPAGGYGYQNYAAPAAGTGLGFAPRTQAPAAPLPSYYTYGQGPEQQFFQQVKPTGGAIAPVTGNKKGGHVSRHAMGGQPNFGGGQPNMLAQGTPAMAPPMSGMPGPQGMQGSPVMQRPMPTATPPAPPAPQMAPRPVQPGALGMAPGAQRPQMGRIMGHMAEGGQPDTGHADPVGVAGPVPQVSSQPHPATSGVLSPSQANLQSVIPHRTMVGHAQGGALSGQQSTQPMHSRHVQGPGDGTSDDIPARLANGEYVLSADVVSGLGNGDNGSGARRLDEFVKNVRVHKSQNASKGKLPADAKPIHKYMGGQ